jgi:hypothetical protein
MGGLLVGAPATAALAAEPTTAAEAQERAIDHLDQAEYYRSLGGVGYKTGLEQRHEAAAARYEAKAAQLAPTPAVTEVPSSAAARHVEDVEALRAMGGVTYKTGIVQWAEAEHKKEHAPAPVSTQPNPSCLPTKPAQDAACINQQQ